MKKIIIQFILAFVAIVLVQAQDRIILKTGDEIQGSVIKVGSNKVQYKKAGDHTGQVLNIEKGALIKIVYENGTVDVFSGDPYSSTPKGAENSAKAAAANRAVLLAKHDEYLKIYRNEVIWGSVALAGGIPLLATGIVATAIALPRQKSFTTSINTGEEFEILPFTVLGPIIILAGVSLTSTGSYLIWDAHYCKRQADRMNLSFNLINGSTPITKYDTAFKNGNSLGVRMSF